MYVKPSNVFIIALILIALPLVIQQQASAIVQVDNTYQQIVLPNGTASNYRLTQNSTAITLETQEGSYILTNACTLYKYPKGLIGNQTPEFSDSYSALASNTSNGTSGWNPVGIINNAACSIYSVSNNTSVWLTGTKTVAGAGSFSVTYFKAPQHDLKITISATNNNPAWTNYHLGLREILSGVGGNVTLGDTTYDLSQHNNTGLNRAFISTHNAQLIQLDKRTSFSMGLGWNNVNSVTDIYHVNNPTLQIDYTYNTPILSPGQTITVDPSITSDTSTTCNTDGATTCNITIGSNPNRMLVLTLNYGIATSSNYKVSSVKIGTTSFTKLSNIIGKGSTEYAYTDVWYLLNPPTGAQTVTVTFGSAPLYSAIGLISLYNVDQITGINNATLATTALTSVSASPMTVTITPTHTGSWTVATGLGYNGMSSPSDTALWTGTLDSGSAFRHSAQYKSSPTIGSGNAMTWANFGALANFGETLTAFEVLSSNPVPAQPTISKVNTLNSTAINATWTNPSGTTWSWLNATLSGGATTHINTTKTFVVLNNYTAGSKYTFSLVAANSTGKSSSSITKYNYTYNVAPTVPVISSITTSQARLSWTNPGASANLTGGFKFFKATPNSGTYSLAGTSSNNTNHFDLTSLLGNQQYIAKISTRYAVGVNYSGSSANSTTVSFYTLPNAPTGLTVSQATALMAHLSWTAPTDNGTVSGYFVEQSSNGGSTWTTLSANTGNSTTTYNKLESAAGTFTFRVSTIKYGGTSSPSGTASRSIWNYFTVNAYHADGITPVYGSVYQSNSTIKNINTPLVSGSAVLPGISQLNNFTIKNALINFVVKKQYNYNATTNHSINMSTYDFNVDCAFTGVGPDAEVFTNGTDGHQITAFTTPTCFANNTMKWKTVFTPNGNSPLSYNTTVNVKILNATYLSNATLKWNTTKVTTVLSSPYIISSNVNVGTGTGATKSFYWSMNLTIAPGFIPVNFTVGHISVSGVNPVTVPIKFTTSIVNSSATAVTVTFPSTYTMGYNVTFGNEGTSHTYTGLPVTSPTLGISQSVITFKNPGNDFVTVKAYDLTSKTSGSYILSQPNTNIPFVTQFQNFKNGLFGTSAMIGGINIIDLIVLIVAMIGLNRANEIVGAFMMVIIVGVAAFFQIITFPTAMVSGIALAVLVTVVTMKKYQNS